MTDFEWYCQDYFARLDAKENGDDSTDDNMDLQKSVGKKRLGAAAKKRTTKRLQRSAPRKKKIINISELDTDKLFDDSDDEFISRKPLATITNGVGLTGSSAVLAVVGSGIGSTGSSAGLVADAINDVDNENDIQSSQEDVVSLSTKKLAPLLPKKNEWTFLHAYTKKQRGSSCHKMCMAESCVNVAVARWVKSKNETTNFVIDACEPCQMIEFGRAMQQQMEPEEMHNDLCHICEFGGDLLCCDSCNQVFHLSCLIPLIDTLPVGDWFCQWCILEDPWVQKYRKSQAGKYVKKMLLEDHRSQCKNRQQALQNEEEEGTLVAFKDEEPPSADEYTVPSSYIPDIYRNHQPVNNQDINCESRHNTSFDNKDNSNVSATDDVSDWDDEVKPVLTNRTPLGTITNHPIVTKRAKRPAKTKWSRQRLTFEDARQTVVSFGLELEVGAEEYWKQQSPVQPSSRKVLLTDGSKPTLYYLRRTDTSTKEEQDNNKVKNKAIGQKNWMETVGTFAAKQVLDPDNKFVWEALPDGMGADVALYNEATGTYTGVQMKSAVAVPGGATNFDLCKKDGANGGRYEHFVIVVVLFPTDFDHIEESRRRTGFEVIPETDIVEMFVFENAMQMPNQTFKPCPRTSINDKYWNHRYVFGFDYPERLEVMKTDFVKSVEKKSMWSKEQLWFGYGEMSPNVNVSSKRNSEMKGLEVLTNIVGIDNLRAPWYQNETVDIIWELDGRCIRISLKKVSEEVKYVTKTYKCDVSKHPNHQYCDYVFAFYWTEGEKIATHISVIGGKRFYESGYISYCWSKYNKVDILEDRIDVLSPDVLGALIKAVSGNAPIS